VFARLERMWFSVGGATCHSACVPTCRRFVLPGASSRPPIVNSSALAGGDRNSLTYNTIKPDRTAPHRTLSGSAVLYDVPSRPCSFTPARHRFYDSDWIELMTIEATRRSPAAGLLIVPKAFYFFWFVALGTFGPFIVLHYRNVGLDLAQIGLLLSLGGILQAAGPLWGLLADALRLRRILLPIAVVGTLIPAALLGQVSAFWQIFTLTTIISLFAIPITPLADSATLAALGNARERYGAQRVWGAVGWGLSTVLSGWLIQRLGLSLIFWAYPIAGGLAALAALAMPRAELATVNVVQAGRTLLCDRRWARFLISATLIGCSGALVHGFFSLYMEDLGAGGEQIGLAYTIASISELPVMALSALALRRWGARPLMVTAGLAYALRMLLYWVAPSPEWALAIQLLHGLCFASLWTAGVVEAQRLAPPGLEATAQSLFGTAVFGIAVALANAIGGVIYRDYGYGALFAAAAFAALVGAGGLAFGAPEEREPYSGEQQP